MKSISQTGELYLENVATGEWCTIVTPESLLVSTYCGWSGALNKDSARASQATLIWFRKVAARTILAAKKFGVYLSIRHGHALIAGSERDLEIKVKKRIANLRGRYAKK